ncbi:glycine zipper 2TM domain-containing protein [Rhodoferax sp. BAB1]|uniref:glycine zipper 2TM domain-containing protein n=1 Tax=Rhodoferax sp. BAB1 TaxID=2741720 RepID=UPI001575A7A0|nr:glycine zipper 2TM domain-containing protein [Rhodoferax sp. BAB1]QKO23286.1 glycine zipper 2TM domain-containing protein [Rhodoferax sp. BAB1]
MSDVTSTGAVVAGTKGLWVAVGVLGLAVVGLGGALYSTLQPKTAAEVEVVSALPEIVAPAPVAEKPVVVEPAPVTKPRPRPVPVKKAQAPSEASPTPVAMPTPAAAPVCIDCATVTAVTPFEREVPTSGVGAVAGGVLGAIVGNQIGQGSGRDAARVIGAIGGGIAGNQIEKNRKKVQAWQVELRMDDGSRRSLELDTPIAVGERVRYDGSKLEPLSR